MSAPDSAARGRALLAERVAAASSFVAAVPEIFEALLFRPERLPRCLVTTGIGTSEGHARHLAELAARALGQPARFATTGSLAEGAPRNADADWLVVFSQGLSANARHALQHVEAWGGVLLVTGLSPTGAGAEGVSQDKLDGLAELERRGVVRIDMGCGPEYGALLRVIGARVGHAIAWSLLRTLAHRRLESAALLDRGMGPDRAELARVQQAAEGEALRVIPRDERVSAFFAPERTLLVMGESGALELCEHLTLKLAEGMLRPQPRAVDVLHFAHGPLQSLAHTPLSILYLAPGSRTPRNEGRAQSPWLARLAKTLDPTLHDLRPVHTELPMPFAVLELEAIFDAWILRHQDETGLDLVAWPGADREAPLYEAGPPLVRDRAHPPTPVPTSIAPAVLENAVWPEVEGFLAAGRRTAIVALGSIEQHGPHLPLATDRWIADALARALAARVADAIALPAIPFGCASEHLDFAGTLHIEQETLAALLRDLLASLRHHGFERAFLFTAHGGNVEALRQMREALVEAAKPVALWIETEIDTSGLQAATVAAQGIPPASAGPHAGEYETSLVAWLRPGNVRAEALAAGPPIAGRVGQDLFYPSLRRNAPIGVLGDPTRAARERGRAYLDAWVSELESAYRRAFFGGAEKKRV